MKEVGMNMSLLLWIIGVYVLLGIITLLIVIVKEPLVLHGWWLSPIVVLTWPYALWGLFNSDDTGRWMW